MVPSLVEKGKDLKIHLTKGGKCITEYLTYDSSPNLLEYYNYVKLNASYSNIKRRPPPTCLALV